MNALRQVVLAATTVAVLAPAAEAQSIEFPRVEVALGLSSLPANGDDFPRPDSTGVQVDVAGNLTSWLGILGDVAWYWGSSPNARAPLGAIGAETSVRTALVGARFTARGERIDVFGQGLFGTATGDAGPGFEGFSDSGLTFGGGGGVTLHLHERLGVRLQLDWLGSFADIVEDNLRLTAGGVLRF